jgi:hypothetical protein
MVRISERVKQGKLDGKIRGLKNFIDLLMQYWGSGQLTIPAQGRLIF